MVLGKHSGRNAFRARMAELGEEFATEEALNRTFARFKALADKKHEIFDDDLQALISSSSGDEINEVVKLVSLHVCTETGETPEARIVLTIEGVEKSGTAQGSGVVDATFMAIESIVHSKSTLQLYSVNNITSGTDAQGKVTVRLEKDGRIVNGKGAHTDIVIASAKAYLNTLNRLYSTERRKHPQGAV
jgi:2-isopropylmalate synthase